MGTAEKAKARLKSEPSDYTFKEARSLLQHLGFKEFNKGKTSGSRVIFVKEDKKILLHKPHPGDEMKVYAIHQLRLQLESLGEI